MTTQPEESPSSQDQGASTPDPKETRLVRVQFPREMTSAEIARIILQMHASFQQREGEDNQP